MRFGFLTKDGAFLTEEEFRTTNQNGDYWAQLEPEDHSGIRKVFRGHDKEDKDVERFLGLLEKRLSSLACLYFVANDPELRAEWLKLNTEFLQTCALDSLMAHPGGCKVIGVYLQEEKHLPFREIRRILANGQRSKKKRGVQAALSEKNKPGRPPDILERVLLREFLTMLLQTYKESFAKDPPIYHWETSSPLVKVSGFLLQKTKTHRSPATIADLFIELNTENRVNN